MAVDSGVVVGMSDKHPSVHKGLHHEFRGRVGGLVPLWSVPFLKEVLEVVQKDLAEHASEFPKGNSGANEVVEVLFGRVLNVLEGTELAPNCGVNEAIESSFLRLIGLALLVHETQGWCWSGLCNRVGCPGVWGSGAVVRSQFIVGVREPQNVNHRLRNRGGLRVLAGFLTILTGLGHCKRLSHDAG